ncbi:MAG: 4Fe-4S binding protein [Paludibacteraceae bacterium]|nr:4Fe-4S binding protein [Paludibacteraceae bacterium]
MKGIYLDNNKCEVCCECINICREDVLGILGGLVKVINVEQCTLCEDCVDICKNEAIRYD